MTLQLALAFSLLAVACSPSNRDVNELQSQKHDTGYFKVDDLAFDTPYSDISQPMQRIVGDATFLAVGEAIHTSSGLHKSMARQAKFAIEKMGFRAVSVETPWKGVDALNAYVNSCAGDQETSVGLALNGIFPVFRTQELANLFSFICKFNARNPKDKVVVFGFDMQQWGFNANPHAYDAKALIDYLELVDADAHEKFAEGLLVCGGTRGNGKTPGPSTENELNLCLTTMNQLVPYFEANQGRYEKRSSKQKTALARVSLEVMKFWPRSSYYSTLSNQFPQNSPEASKFSRKSRTVRDEGMARVFVETHAAYAQDAKTLLIGHTGHFAHDGENFMNFVDKNMGSWMDDFYGEEYKVIASVAQNLEKADWWEGEGVYVPEGENLQHWLEPKLAELGSEFALIDTKQNSVIEADRSFILSNGGFAVPSRHLDGLFFMVDSPAMTPVEGAVYP